MIPTPQVVSFFAAGNPKGQPRPRAFARDGHTRVYDPGTAEGWKGQIAEAARQGHLLLKPMEGPLKLSLLFTMPRTGTHYRSNGQVKDRAPLYHMVKPDCDNLAKAVMDALTILKFWRDDNQVAEMEILKLYGDVPGCRITIVELVAKAAVSVRQPELLGVGV